MGEAVGGSLPYAVGLAVSPFPLIAMVLILGTPRGRVNGAVFAVVSILGLAAVATTVVLLADGDAATDSGAPSSRLSGLRLALGLLLLAYAARVLWARRSAGAGADELPGWMRAMETLTPARAAGMALVLSTVNPKNLVLAIAGAGAVAQAEAPPGRTAAALAIMVVIGTLGVTGPLATTLAFGDRGDAALGAVKDWMIRNDDVIVAVVALIFGVSLVGDAISGLSG